MAKTPRASPQHPAPQRQRVGWLRQLIAILIAPAAWIAQMALSAMLIPRGCRSVNLTLIGVSALCFLIGVAATLVAWRSWRRSRTEATGESGQALDAGEGRTRFLALLSVCTNSLFLMAMLFTASAFLLIAPCRHPATNVIFTPADVAQGAYLARIGDCTSCHTAKGDPAFAGGYPLHSPFGTIYGTNITPDPVYGIGTYSLGDFDRALRRGIAKDGHHLYPAMPYRAFARISDGDVRALYAYFHYGVTPVASRPPQTRLPFPLSQRWAIWFWNRLFLRQGVYQPRTDHDALWNRGAYLVTGLGHCSACHTPRNIAYAEKAMTDRSTVFLSGTDVDKWHAVNLRGDQVTGLGRWTTADIAGFLQTGHAQGPQGHAIQAMGSMAQMVENSGQYMSDGDRLAIAIYLKSLKAGGDDTRLTAVPLTEVFERPGAGLYAQACAKCHGASGEGKAGVFPQLAGNPVVLSASPTSLIHLVLTGGAPPITSVVVKPKAMPAFAHKLDDREIANVLTYIRQGFGNHAGSVDEATVRALRAKLAATGQSSADRP